MKQTMLVLAVGFLVACGGSPTAPAAITQPDVHTTPISPTPADPPATPPPSTPPSTPAPPPAPAPAPTPPSPSRTILHAIVTSSHWYPGATFTLPETFDVVIEGDTAKIATLDPLPFGLYRSDDDFIVKQKDFEFVVQGGTFAFNGLAGQATGTIAK